MEIPDGKQVIIQPRLLDRKGMALAASISTDTLDKIRKLGCPEITVPGTTKFVFDPDDVIEWIKENSRPADTRSEKEASEELDSLLRNYERGDTLRTA